MIIIGHRFIPSENFYHVPNIDAISKTPPSSCIYLEFCEENLDTIEHATKNNVTLALGVKNLTELIYASNLLASYIIVEESLASQAQAIANEYLYDAKVLVNIYEESQIQEFAKLGIDGVIFSNSIIKITS